MRIARVAVALLAGATIGVAPASAHSALDKSEPRDRDRLDAPPSEVWGEYTEPPATGAIEVYDHCDRRIDDGNTVILGFRMTVGVAPSDAARFTVRWTAVSAVDGHRTFGAWRYSVSGGDTSCPGGATAPEQPPPSTNGPEPGPSRGSDARAPAPDRGDDPAPRPSGATGEVDPAPSGPAVPPATATPAPSGQQRTPAGFWGLLALIGLAGAAPAFLVREPRR